MPMTLGRRIHGVEMIELRTRRSIKSVPALEIRVRRDAPARPTQAQPPFAFVDAPASQEIQPRPAAQTPNVRHLADEVLAIIDRRATAARERLERR
ncbi:hypothetical protein [Thiococcus pfennigii]|uniref:hypothetical protein n=1 Tax=Thiococcus pfennigii TaxID=1057 RepID=UPI0019044D59|nr:hypothetical protein [Thiococcus pfennigii]MBK1699385.1 hypothetical protein [Thiococcus pfennigii]